MTAVFILFGCIKLALMSETEISPRKKTSADWLFRGVLTRIGDTFDRFTGRRWTPSSSLATSELIERIKKLLDVEARNIPGKGKVVPHLIKLKIQWDKFSTDSETLIDSLSDELLTATIDHINDSLYYTYAPVELEVKIDYFVDGVKLLAGFDKFDEDDREVEMNVTVPAVDVSHILAEIDLKPSSIDIFTARFKASDKEFEIKLEFPINGRLSVGRTSENPLQINDGSISKIHATLALTEDGTLSVADTGSTNGTFINGERIAYGKAILLDKDDVVKFGLVDVTFEHTHKRVIDLSPVVADQESEKMETVEIDGFEFKSRISPEGSEIIEESNTDDERTATIEHSENFIVIQPETVSPQPLNDSSPQIKMPDTVLELGFDSPEEQQPQHGDEAIDQTIPMPGIKE